MIYVIETTGYAYSMRRYFSGLSHAMVEHDKVEEVICPRSKNGAWQKVLKYFVYSFRMIALPKGAVKVLISERYTYLLPFMGFSNTVVVCHDLHTLYPQARAGLVAKVQYRCYLWLMSKASKTVCVSKYTRDDLLRYYPTFPKHKIHVVHNGIEDLWFGSSVKKEGLPVTEDKKVLLSVGTDAWYKDFSLAISIIKQLGDDYIILRIGEIGKNNSDRIQSEGLSDHIIHLTDVDDQMLKEAYERAHCLLFPSKSEGFGWPVVEAMASGCPVVTSGLGAITEVVQGSALICHELTEYLSAIDSINDSALRNELIAKGQLRAQSFTWSQSSIKFKEVIHSLNG